MAKTTKKKDTGEKKSSGKYLVIVESPAKAKTIKKILGDDYQIKASVGHIRDLPAKVLGVDVKNNFEPVYEIMPGKDKVVKELSEAAKEADNIYLAPDPDREGEAIAWHIQSILDKPKESIYRIEFNEITKTAILDAVKNPRAIDMNKVNAQQTRRILDRLVGYKISPILWQKVGKGLSAGRVQSVAVRLICDREKEIEAFVPKEYWTIGAELAKPKSTNSFVAELTKFNGEKIEINNEEEATKVVNTVNDAEFKVAKVTNRESKRNPQAPFITSTIQREASTRLGYSVKKTMQIAQKLYEGIDMGSSGPVGLITYMRTDSTRISDEAKDSAKEYIVGHYGKNYYPETPRVYIKKSKNTQDAHEAIRPTYIDKSPESIKQYLSSEQYRLYKLIWERFVASQMESASVKTISAEIEAENYTFRASSSKIVFDGFLIVYDDREEDEKSKAIPELTKGDVLKLKKIDPKQHFTQPPPRFSEATLVKTLEEVGVGRPSTYAPTIATIQDRGYVIKEEKTLAPTALGKTVNELLVKHFPNIVDASFTADMETKLDDIAENAVVWQQIIGNFYGPFAEVLKKAKEEMEKVSILTEHNCTNCGKPMALKSSRWGSQFLGCSGYPECKTTMPLTKDQKPVPEDKPSDEICEKCSSPMVIKYGPYGEYLACTNDSCKTRKKLIKKTGVNCPQENCAGEIVQKKSRYGKIFYGCSKYPDCTFALWNEPTGDKCPECGSMLVTKVSKAGNKIACSSKECKYQQAVENSSQS
ncbi:MAG: DNA topoisomerase I [Candidatus Melainabacteria bacterium RIFOXYA12_FULL_32_12]|nr:MAG: DNA topoisomerase I [Candidatus Melainabacteria bacterium RIFOXYA2_FULL_32_9]OGI31681.1 MAG: DNA topoisomerase I [Candidatus Melainabacteria bacterium RIFOXYA12_FULL_32_12]